MLASASAGSSRPSVHSVADRRGRPGRYPSMAGSPRCSGNGRGGAGTADEDDVADHHPDRHARVAGNGRGRRPAMAMRASGPVADASRRRRATAAPRPVTRSATARSHPAGGRWSLSMARTSATMSPRRASRRRARASRGHDIAGRASISSTVVELGARRRHPSSSESRRHYHASARAAATTAGPPSDGGEHPPAGGGETTGQLKTGPAEHAGLPDEIDIGCARRQRQRLDGCCRRRRDLRISSRAGRSATFRNSDRSPRRPPAQPAAGRTRSCASGSRFPPCTSSSSTRSRTRAHPFSRRPVTCERTRPPMPPWGWSLTATTNPAVPGPWRILTDPDQDGGEGARLPPSCRPWCTSTCGRRPRPPPS